MTFEKINFQGAPYYLVNVAAKGIYLALTAMEEKEDLMAWWSQNTFTEGKNIERVKAPEISIAVKTIPGGNYSLDIITKMREFASVTSQEFVSSDFNFSNNSQTIYPGGLEVRVITPVLFRRI